MRNYATISCVCKKVSEKKIVSGNMISCMVFLFKFTRNSQTRGDCCEKHPCTVWHDDKHKNVGKSYISDSSQPITKLTTIFKLTVIANLLGGT